MRTTGSSRAGAANRARELEARQHYFELSAFNNALPGLVAILRAAVILGIGGSLVLAGEMTLGALVGFYILAEMFLSPIGQFLEFADRRQALQTDLQRLEDISSAAEDPVIRRRSPESESISTFNGRLQLSGALELRDVTFGFNKRSPTPAQGVQPDDPARPARRRGGPRAVPANRPWRAWCPGCISPGQARSCLTGTCAMRSRRKSCASPFPWWTRRSCCFPHRCATTSPCGTRAIPDEAIFAATRDAWIHDEILLRPQGYATEVEEGGVNFSGGQRQRLEIARALVGNPTVLILDEATSALDAATEEHVDDALRRRGVTCLIVAHRPEHGARLRRDCRARPGRRGAAWHARCPDRRSRRHLLQAGQVGIMQDTRPAYSSIAELAVRLGTDVPCAGNLPVKLDDADSIWFIEQGAVNLFLVEYKDGVEQSAPQHLLRREAGWFLPGVPAHERDPQDDTTLSLVGKGLPGTLLKRLPVSLLPKVHPGELAEQTDAWLSEMTDTLSRFAAPRAAPDGPGRGRERCRLRHTARCRCSARWCGRRRPRTVRFCSWTSSTPWSRSSPAVQGMRCCR